jgi:hypothetical protein
MAGQGAESGAGRGGVKRFLSRSAPEGEPKKGGCCGSIAGIVITLIIAGIVVLFFVYRGCSNMF